MNRLTLFIPATTAAGPGERPKRTDLSPGSPVRRLMAEAEVLGIAVEVDPMLDNQVKSSEARG